MGKEEREKLMALARNAGERLFIAQRLDSVWFDLSRSASTALVEQGRVFVNWRQQTNPSEPVSEGDTISCRGLGRFRVLECSGLTKKGREKFVLAFPSYEGQEEGPG